ncbi:MAG: TRAP transporter small permease subunit [Methyloversatilis sp.]|nr:TRAP transporter small permease subunit [Methyloversatilis sp.]
MQQLLLRIDRFNTLVGHAFAWTVVLLTLVITWEVFSRYVLNTPHAWVFDATYMLYGTLFMMAGAYTLAASGHVRGDVLYGFFRPRTQATLDLILYFVFFIPGVLALCWAGWDFASESWVINEHSSVSADGPPIYPFKAIIPLAGASLMLQGVVEILRCIICIRQGEWPSRVRDVEEVDVEKLRHMVHADPPEEASAGSAK